MVRVPNTISFGALGLEPDESSAPEPPLHAMPDREVDAFIRQCAAALRSHARDFHRGHDKDNALAAFESAMALLLEVHDVYPGKRAHIDPVLVEHGYPVPEN
ncbi:hypothetical protein [Devosia sp. CAU 1758]